MTPAEPYSPHPAHDWLPAVVSQGAFVLIFETETGQQEALYDLDYFTDSARDTYRLLTAATPASKLKS